MNTCMLLLPLPAETKAGSVAAPAGTKDSARLALPAWAVLWATKGLLAGVPGCDSRAGWAGFAAGAEPLATWQSAAVACALMLRYGQRAMPCLRASFCKAGGGGGATGESERWSSVACVQAPLHSVQHGALPPWGHPVAQPRSCHRGVAAADR